MFTTVIDYQDDIYRLIVELVCTAHLKRTIANCRPCTRKSLMRSQPMLLKSVCVINLGASTDLSAQGEHL